MAKIDGVIEAVRYKSGKIDLVRLYERRGATFSDHVLLDRPALLGRLKDGKHLVTGRRKPLLASTFDVGLPVLLSGDKRDSIVTTSGGHGPDRLEGVPLF
jgi:hypothetical protein